MAEPGQLESLADYFRALKVDKASHDAEVLLLACIDFRFFLKCQSAG